MLNSIEPIVIFNRFDYEFRNMYSGGLTSVFKHGSFWKNWNMMLIVCILKV